MLNFSIYAFYFLIIGYREIAGTLRKTFAGTCELCQPGTFGAYYDRSKCETCRAGVICLTGESFLLQ